MRTVRFANIALALSLSVATLVVALAGNARAAVGTPTVLDNGTVQLGVNPGGNLVAPGGPPSPSGSTADVGVRFKPAGNEGVSLGSAQESWGVADADSGTTGSVNKARGDRNASVAGFSSTGTTASSVVDVGAAKAGAPSFKVTHDFRPSDSPNLFEAIVIVENTGTTRAGDVRYRRVVDWDVEPTPSDEFATVGGEKVPALLFSSNEGFADQDPLRAPENWGASGFFSDSGPDDLGALVDLGLGALEPGQKRSFALYYGAAADEAEALLALREVAAEFHAFGQPNVDGKDGGGAPTTFVLAFDTKPPNTSPAAKADAYETDEDKALNVPAPGLLGNDADPENSPLTARLERGPEHGTLDLEADGSFSYAPNKDFSGRDSFTYRASDGAKASRTTTVEIAVKAVNDPPTVSDVPDRATDEDTPTGSIPFAVGDVETAPGELKVTAASDNPGLVPADNVVVEGAGADRTVKVTPAKDRHGTATITLTASDGPDANAAKTSDSFVLTVRPVNDAPTGTSDAHAVDEDGTLAVPAPGVLGNDLDADKDPLAAEVVGQPLGGTLTMRPDGSFGYEPKADFNGEDSFSYKACDNADPRACSEPTRATVSVRAANDAPKASDDSASTVRGKPVTVDVLGNDADVENDALTVGGHTQGANGDVNCSANGACTYAPKPGFDGDDSFSYTVSDGNGGAATAKVSVGVALPPPETTIASGPSGVVGPAASFALSSDQGDATFECSMDGEAFSACASTKEYAGLSDGVHSFRARAVGRTGFVDGSPSERSFAVDAKAPAVTDRKPANLAGDAGWGTDVQAVFSEDLDAGSVNGATFSLLEEGAAEPVPAAVRYDAATNTAVLDPEADLGPATTYRVTVRGGQGGVKDAVGNALMLDEAWTFSTRPPDTTPPETTMVSGPEGPTKNASPSFAFSSNEPDSAFRCSLDDGPFADCSSPASYPNLSEGSHVFRVAATDASGNEDASAAQRNFKVDLTAPSVSGREPAKDAVRVARNASVIVTFSEEIAPATATQVSLLLVKKGQTAPVAASVTPDPSGKAATIDPSSDLESETSYAVTIRGGDAGIKDKAGNALTADDSWSFTTADTVAPAPPVMKLAAASDTGASGSDGLTNDNTPTLEGTAEANSTVRVYEGTTLLGTATAGPGGAWSVDAAALADGTRYLRSTATDASGNTSGQTSGEMVTSSSSGLVEVKIDTARPSVATVSPPAGTNTVAAGANALAAFSEPMDATTMNASAFALVRSGTTTALAATVSYNATTNQAVLDPGANLLAGAAYSATVRAAARDMAGNAMAADKAWSFSVNSVPTVTSVTPGNGATTTDRTPLVAATVRDAQTDLAKANITLVVDGATIGSTAYSYDRATDRLSYTSSRAVGKHTVRITAKDAQGLVHTTSWYFYVK